MNNLIKFIYNIIQSLQGLFSLLKTFRLYRESVILRLASNITIMAAPYKLMWARYAIYGSAMTPIFILGSFLILKFFFYNLILELVEVLYYQRPFFDTATMTSFLINLEHIYVCYYLVIILVVVYWSLYICLDDFMGWSFEKKGFSLWVYNYSFWFYNSITPYIKTVYNYLLLIYWSIYCKLLLLLKNYKEKEMLCFLYFTHINFNANSSISSRVMGFIPFFLQKKVFNSLNANNLLVNNIEHYDLFGRSHLISNWGLVKFFKLLIILFDTLKLIVANIRYIHEILLNKQIGQLLFYTTSKSYFFSSTNNMFSYFKIYNSSKLWLHMALLQLRALYTETFIINQFRHSGVFEGVWAAFPTLIITGILIPSLVLLYSFEDILNPRLTIKVLGNQWYWTYEFDNWISYIDEKAAYWNFRFDSLRRLPKREIFVSFAFDSIILPTTELLTGTKRLLEVDNRLVLPVNVTTRFLVSSSDVLHSFAMPELGFKIDAVPGRLNQILVFISRPGIYYGQCSELCGANHAFMPIVIQCVSPDVFLNYLEAIQIETDAIEINEGNRSNG